MSLSEVDRLLLQRCLDSAPRAWEDFIDRFLGLVVHVANHTATTRGLSLDTATRDDLVAEVFLALVREDFAVLRRFRRNCSLATYLTVISRRIIVRRMIQARRGQLATRVDEAAESESNSVPQRMEDREEVQQLMLRLDDKEANVVRMFHLEGKTYQEISQATGISENSVGPVLSRAREKMRGSQPGGNGRH
ncbi:RNA polymerase sigma factor SigX [Rubripirellula obstinata]|uniref:RNA polymerase sigma factor SigX n=1 Tax=Rubripirellula obstinata TaxID=406547 RepID=A0A5B1CGC4_9BACT|nr:sigma-70 family RNA polymerase sigma factor [Rubripirellula obstinata]KAA1259232.1 RNA polymerase sigma factor SigX [Rubripirellula obstinata]